MEDATKITALETASIVPGDNDRTAFDTVELQKLADSLQAHGLAQPITVRPIGDGIWQIVAGERRFRAAQLLGWPTIPAIVREMDDEQAAAIMLVENVMRVDLNPIDEARAYDKRGKQFGWSAPQIAAHAKVPVSRVRARLALLDLITEAQILVQGGNMALGYAEAMVDLDHNRQYQALRYFSQARRPSLNEFKMLCGELLAAQAQDSLFDIDSFLQAQEAGGEYESHNVRYRKGKRYPTTARLPKVNCAVTVGVSIERYIVELMKSGDPYQQEAAAIIGTLYDGLIAGNSVQPPKDASKSPLNELQEMGY